MDVVKLDVVKQLQSSLMGWALPDAVLTYFGETEGDTLSECVFVRAITPELAFASLTTRGDRKRCI